MIDGMSERSDNRRRAAVLRYVVVGWMGLACLAGVSGVSVMSGCQSTPASDANASYGVTFVRGVTYREGYAGYQADLPGFRVVGDIASLRLDRISDRASGPLVLGIRAGGRPMLEHFEAAAADGSWAISGSFFDGTGEMDVQTPTTDGKATMVHRAPANTYLRMDIVGDEVRLTLKPALLEQLGEQFTVRWIDYYRG